MSARYYRHMLLRSITRIILTVFICATMLVLFISGLAYLDREEALREATGGVYLVAIPDCQEDEPYLRGGGDFNGRVWETYTCVHIDQVESPDALQGVNGG